MGGEPSAAPRGGRRAVAGPAYEPASDAAGGIGAAFGPAPLRRVADHSLDNTAAIRCRRRFLRARQHTPAIPQDTALSVAPAASRRLGSFSSTGSQHDPAAVLEAVGSGCHGPERGRTFPCTLYWRHCDRGPASLSMASCRSWHGTSLLDTVFTQEFTSAAPAYWSLILLGEQVANQRAARIARNSYAEPFTISITKFDGTTATHLSNQNNYDRD